MNKETQIEVITYEQERLDFFTKAMNLAQKRYNRLFKIFKDEPYLSEGTTIVSDAGRETQFYHDVVEMLENGCRRQSGDEEDVVCVLRCKDCKYWKHEEDVDFVCTRHYGYRTSTDYCSYAERK